MTPHPGPIAIESSGSGVRLLPLLPGGRRGLFPRFLLFHSCLAVVGAGQRSTSNFQLSTSKESNEGLWMLEVERWMLDVSALVVTISAADLLVTFQFHTCCKNPVLRLPHDSHP